MQHLTVSSNDPAPLNNNNKRRDATRYLYKCKSMCVCVFVRLSAKTTQL